jgi:transcriptional regulator with GAF, ATPase, and Fis domain
LLLHARDLGYLDIAANIVTHLVSLHLARGDWSEARLLIEEGLSIARKRNHRRDELTLLWSAAYLEHRTGYLPRSARMYRQAVIIAEELRAHQDLCRVLGNLAEIELLRGDPNTAQRLAHRAMQLEAAHSFHGWDDAARMAEAMRLRLAGHAAAAKSVITPVVCALSSEPRVHLDVLVLLVESTRIELALGDLEAARNVYARLAAMSERLATPYANALVLVLRAEIEARCDSGSECRSAFSKALEACRAAGLEVDRWLAHSEYGHYLLLRGKSTGRTSLLGEAVEQLDMARDGLSVAGAGTSIVRDRLLEAFGAIKQLRGTDPVAGATGLIERVYDVLRALSSPERLQKSVLDLVAEIVGAGRGVLVLRNRKTGRLEVTAAYNLPRRIRLRALEVSRTVIQDVLRSGEPIVASDTDKDSRLRDRDSIRLYEVRGVVCIPLSVDGHVFGALYVDRQRDALSLSPPTRRLLESVAACISAAIDNTRRQQDQQRANQQLHRRNISLSAEIAADEGCRELVGSSAAMRQLRQTIDRVADQDGPVLVIGPSGTGKELVARALHYWSSRQDRPFLASALMSVPSPLVLNTLFGIKKGRATGVEASRGLFELVEDGTLFLDEITEVDADVQAALLRVVEEREFTPIGSQGKSQPFRGRLICATNRDPRRALHEGHLRADLYHRISTYVIDVPPLQERSDDIPSLIEHFLRKYTQRLGNRAPHPPAEFVEACTRDPWTEANVRELRKVVERAVTTARTAEDWLRVYEEHVARRTGRPPRLGLKSYMDRLQEFERAEITRALRSVDWSQAAAARLLQLPESTLRYKLRTLGIQTPPAHSS